MTINELTFAPRGNYAESLKTAKAAFTPRQSVFLRLKKMTTLSEVYGVYTNLRRIFNSYNPENYDKDTEEVNTAMCGALCELETAMAYLPIEDKADRKLKLKLLKQSLSLAAERADGTIDLDNLSATAREQLTMALQLIKE